MKFVITWISLLFLALGSISYADEAAKPDQAESKSNGSVASANETAGPDIVKFKSGGAISVLYKHYEGDYVTIYLFDPKDGILVVKKSFLDEPPLTVIKTETKQKPVSKVKIKKRWRWKRK